jgi:uncharacterized GH25 family protein
MAKHRKILIASFGLCIVTFLCHAHEFWMQPNQFKFQPGEAVGFDFMVGENFEGERWSLKRHKVARLEQHTLTNVEKIAMPADTSKQPLIEAALKSQGGHLVVMQSDNAYLELEAEKFNAYLKEDGLDDAMNYRIKTNTTDKPSREFYQRNAKLLLQCGTMLDDTYRKKTGLPLEIIPLSNPYAVKPGEELKFRLTFKDKPHGFALVKVWHKAEDRTFMQNVYTDKEGIITTRISGKGMWMISSVKMVASESKTADWQSYWGSLVFGVN